MAIQPPALLGGRRLFLHSAAAGEKGREIDISPQIRNQEGEASDDLRAYFEAAGEVPDVKIIRDAGSGMEKYMQRQLPEDLSLPRDILERRNTEGTSAG